MSMIGKATSLQESYSQGERLIITPNSQEAAELLIYELRPEMEAEFFGVEQGEDGFYRQVILPWLKMLNVPRSDVWVVKRFDDRQMLIGLQLVIVSSPDPPPWDPGIDGLNRFLKGAVNIHSRPDLKLP